MIPKKIHYCWLSNEPLPAKLQACVESWKKYLPDYEIVKWDLNKFPLEKNIWVRQAFESKRYAFAADYIRLYALATEGGIYFDSDVEVIKPFDDLLDLPYFICKENSPQGLEAATIGKGTSWVLKCLDYYKDRKFVNDNGEMNTIVLPRILLNCIKSSFQIEDIYDQSHFGKDKNTIYVFPHDYFSPKNYVTKKLIITTNTYSIHHFAGTWIPTWKKILLKLWVPFSVKYPIMAKIIKKYL